MKAKYIKFKSDLVEQGFITRDIETGTGIPLPALDVRYNPVLGGFLEEFVKLDRDKSVKPEEKYSRLLHRAMKIYVEGLKSALSQGKKGDKEHQFIQEFKKFLDDNVKDKNDALFFLRYEMATGILKSSDRNRIRSQVLEGKMSTEEGAEELKKLAQQMFLTASTNQIKKGCARIILADVNMTDIEKIDESCQYNKEGVSPYYHRIYYDARGVEDPKYNTYRETLQNLFSVDDTRKNLPQIMNVSFDSLGNGANDLYQDPKETEETKANCNKLMEEIVVYRSELAEIRSKQTSLPSIPKNKRPEYEEEIKQDLLKLEKRSERINDKINQLSADTSSKRWGKIVLFATIVVALGIITGGFGLGIGVDWMMRSIRSDSDFFKVNKEHHALVSQARKLIKQSDSATLDLSLPNEEKLPDMPKSAIPEEIEMEDLGSRRGSLGRDG